MRSSHKNRDGESAAIAASSDASALLAQFAPQSGAVVIPCDADADADAQPAQKQQQHPPYFVHALRPEDAAELAALQAGLHADFLATYSNAVRRYVLGDWAAARALFEQCLAWAEDDQPTLTVLEFMESSDFVAPAAWAGYRVVDSVDL